MKLAQYVKALAVLVAAGGATLLYKPAWLTPVAPDAQAWSAAARAALPAGLASAVRLGPEAPAGGQPQGDGRKGGPGGPGGGRPPVSVVLAEATRKASPVRFEAIGSVQPLAAVTVRSRVDSQVVQVAVADGAFVQAGDVLLRLDSRQIDAQVKQAEAQLAKSRATLEQNERDAERLAGLLARGSGTQLAADNARTMVVATKAQIASDQAALENLRVQQTYYTIKAPISGRIGVVALKEGAVARQGETTGAITTINQMTPIYVAFSVPQGRLADLRDAMAKGQARAFATPQGGAVTVEGAVAVIDNAIDAATGSITARATFENGAETLWPGQYCNVHVQLRVENDALVVPREAVQNGQNGQFIFVAEGDTAKLRPVTVERVVDAEAVIAKGVQAGDKVVVDGQTLLTPGSRIAPRQGGKARAGGEPATPSAPEPGKKKTPG